MNSAAATCAEITATHARTFAAASRFLPEEKRRASFAVYAFCRVADDIVDEFSGDDQDAATSALAEHRARLDALTNGVAPSDDVFSELAWAMRRFEIPAAPFYELLDALSDDLLPAEFVTWPELSLYCTGVASTVGEMCAHVFGVRAGEAAQALNHARTLGVALQLTNILRDVGEDAARGRCYLPSDDLAAYGIERNEILTQSITARDPRWRELMRHEIARARALYELSAPGLALIDRDARCCATICSRGYAAILSAIEARNYDSLTGRARIGVMRKGAIMIGARVSTWNAGELIGLMPARSRA